MCHSQAAEQISGSDVGRRLQEIVGCKVKGKDASGHRDYLQVFRGNSVEAHYHHELGRVGSNLKEAPSIQHRQTGQLNGGDPRVTAVYLAKRRLRPKHE